MKKFIMYWENDCGYGTEYFETEAERDEAIEEAKRFGTEAWPGVKNETTDQS